MTKLEKAKEAYLDFTYHFKYVVKVLVFQAALVLMVCGVLYLMNFKISVEPIVTVISPVAESVE